MTETAITKKYYLFFPKCVTDKPIVYHLVKDYNLIVNIFRAKVTAQEEGYLSLDITGARRIFSAASTTCAPSTSPSPR